MFNTARGFLPATVSRYHLATWRALVALISAVTFALAKQLSPIDALYLTVTTMATVGYGDLNLLEAPNWLKVCDVGLMAVSAVLVASRIDRADGGGPGTRRGAGGRRDLAGHHP